MTTTRLTLDQIRQAGLAALMRALGPVGTVRFLQQFEQGSGDSTAERHTWLPTADVLTLARRIRDHQQDAARPVPAQERDRP